jgi:hypothetical protein
MIGTMRFFKDLDCSMENQGEKLVITIKGDNGKVAEAEKKIKALQELCCCGNEGCSCC